MQNSTTNCCYFLQTKAKSKSDDNAVACTNCVVKAHKCRLLK